jgi:hypothetical protein
MAINLPPSFSLSQVGATITSSPMQLHAPRKLESMEKNIPSIRPEAPARPERQGADLAMVLRG